MSERTKDNFEKGIFWELYRDLERQFQNFLEYVPYLSGNETVFSFKLLNMILSVGGHIDSAFKEMARYPDLSTNDDCKKVLDILRESEENIKKGEAPKTVPTWLSLRAFENEYGLSQKKVILKFLPEGEEIIPFEPHNPKTNAPEWWEIYNGLKHDVGVNIRKANLRNTLHALAGAFMINIIHIPACLRLIKLGLVDLGEIPNWQTEEWVRTKKRIYGSMSTSLFKYDYDQ